MPGDCGLPGGLQGFAVASSTPPMALSDTARAHLGHGVGLRVPHFGQALGAGLDVDLVEAVSENFFGGGGRPMAVLERLRKEMPVVLHGVSLAVGSTAPVREDYLDRLATLVRRIEPAWVSDHLCWGANGGHHLHDLLPLPYTRDAVAHVVRRVSQVQDALGRRILLENVSSYVGFTDSEMSEWEFLREVVVGADAMILLDVNNVVVNAKNFGFDPRAYIDGIPRDRVQQLHLANHTDMGHYKHDSHRGAVPDEVWSLFEYVVETVGAVTTIVEWDEDVPEWEVLRGEAERARVRERGVLGRAVGGSSALDRAR